MYVLEHSSEPIVKEETGMPVSFKVCYMMWREDTCDRTDSGIFSPPHTLFLLSRNEPAPLCPVRAQLPPRLPLAERLRPG